MTPLVSVIVITYNHVKYIQQCLDSILMQKTSFDFEIILGEDDSKDGTREICIDYAKRFPDKIKLFLRSRKDVIMIDGSPTGRYNFIENFRASQGKYIAVCEGDDFWTDSYKLQKQVDVLEKNPSLSGCFHNSEERYWNDYTKASSLYLSLKEGGEVSISDFTKFNMVPTASVVFRTPVPEELYSPEFLKLPMGDWPLHLLNARKGNYYYLPQVMSVRNLNPSSTWGMQDQKRNVEKVCKALSLLVQFGWFKVEINSLLNQSRLKLENSIAEKEKDSKMLGYKKALIHKMIGVLNKL
ncbi:MAG: glycosyltransferase family A protein [Bacteroidota bacterium]